MNLDQILTNWGYKLLSLALALLLYLYVNGELPEGPRRTRAVPAAARSP